MNIVYAAAEAVPFAKVGGLGDVIGSLPQEISKLGNNCSVCIPYYSSIKGNFELFHTINNEAEVYRIQIKNVAFFLIKTTDLFRENVYGTIEEDEAVRFAHFSRMVIRFVNERLPETHIIHSHDWHTSLISIYLKELNSKIKSVFTIHNLAFQGIIGPEILKKIGIPPERFHIEDLEFYGKVNLMKGAIVNSHAVTTVSKTYAEEIMEHEHGFGLEGILTHYKNKIVGIVNGLDYEHFNPATDKTICSNYSSNNISPKENCKKAVCIEAGFSFEAKRPLLGFVSRLTEQKGIDIIIKSLDEIIKSGADFVMLGSGNRETEEFLREYEKKHSGRFKLFTRFDLSLAQRIYSGSDFYLMPSKFEPCGLSQLIAMRYGTIPIAREVGGLKDTITNGITGFLFKEYSSKSLVECVRKSVSLYNNKAEYNKMVISAMRADFSWENSAKVYDTLYKNIK